MPSEQKAALPDPTKQCWLLRDKPGALGNSACLVIQH